MNLARLLASNVLPTPVGPAKMNEPIGRFGSFKPARLLRTAFDSDLIASSWLTTVPCSSSSILRSRLVSSSPTFLSGTPVILETTSADDLFVDHAVGFLGLLAPLFGQRLFFLAELVGLVPQ